MKKLEPWEHGFGLSTYGKDIWFVRAGRISPPPGVPFETSLTRLRRAYSTEATWEFADGFLLKGGVANGGWVRGWAAMRYLCLSSGFELPAKQLRGEPFLPDPDLLVFTVAEWARTGPVYGYRNPYERPISASFDHRDRFWALLADIHKAEGIDIGTVVAKR